MHIFRNTDIQAEAVLKLGDQEYAPYLLGYKLMVIVMVSCSKQINTDYHAFLYFRHTL